MDLTLLSLTAGRSLPICAPYSAVKMLRLSMLRRTIAPTWRKNERAFTDRAGAGRRIFREQPLYGPFVPPRINCRGGAGAQRRRRIRESAPTELFMALCLCIFLHPLRGLFFLDDRSSCHRRRMVGGGAASVGKYCGIAGGPGVSFRANSSPPSSSLRMDGHSAWTRAFA